MLEELRTGKDWEGSTHKLTEVLSWHLPGGTEESHNKLVLDIMFTDQNSN
jgi:hypothetical protein